MLVYKALGISMLGLMATTAEVAAVTLCTSPCDLTLNSSGTLLVDQAADLAEEIQVRHGAGLTVIGPDSGDPNFDQFISVNGNLYLDFSLWGNTGSISAREGMAYEFNAEQLSVLANDDTPVIVEEFELIQLDSALANLNLAGNYLLFSQTVIPSSSFEVSDSIVVGDFSNYNSMPAPVPLPATIWMFLTGLVVVFWRSIQQIGGKPISA